VRAFPNRPMHPEPRSYLYLMVDVGGCKIGISNRPARRRWEMPYPSRIDDASGADYVPPVVKQWYLPDGLALIMEGDVKMRFAGYRVGNHTEWFNVSPHQIIQAVESTVRARFSLEPCRWYKDGTILFWPIQMPSRRCSGRLM
jgi:hypothetical protein